MKSQSNVAEGFSLQVIFFLLMSLLIFSFVSQVNATTSLTYEYDANGNLIQGDGKYYEYNDANQLVRVRHGDQNGTIIAEYFYDYTGQRIKKVEDGVTTYYIGKHYETQVDGGTQSNTSYYFANGERVAKKDSSGNVYYYHLDHLGGTNVITDSSGNLVERLKYYPFGEIRQGGNERYSFTGKEKDKLTEFYYFEARYYNPEFKHFTQADTIVSDLYEPQDLNRYAYVRNNPMKLVDLTGHWSESVLIQNLSKTETGEKLLVKNDNEEIIIFRNREEFKMKTGATDEQVIDFANRYQEEFKRASGYYCGSYFDKNKGEVIHLIYLKESLNDYQATADIAHELKHKQQGIYNLA